MTFREFFKLRPHDPDPRRAKFARLHSRMSGVLGILIGAVVAVLFDGPIIAALLLAVVAAVVGYGVMLVIWYALYQRGESDK